MSKEQQLEADLDMIIYENEILKKENESLKATCNRLIAALEDANKMLKRLPEMEAILDRLTH